MQARGFRELKSKVFLGGVWPQTPLELIPLAPVMFWKSIAIHARSSCADVQYMSFTQVLSR